MAVIIEWEKPSATTSYSQTRVYRSTSETGTYTVIGTVTDIDTTYYYDSTGTTLFWYKIDFYDPDQELASTLSDAVQGGEATGYCTPDDVRDITNLTTSDLTDTEIWKLIKHAGVQLNSEISVYHEDEKIQWWATDRENEIDGSNVTFYTQKYPLGDANNDMLVNTSDMSVASVDANGTRTAATVSAIDAGRGSFTLATAPDTDKIWYVTYYSVPKRVDTTGLSKLVKLATMFLAAAYAYSKINVGKAKHVQLGNVKFLRHMESFDEYYSKYEKILCRINSEMADTIEGGDLI